MFSLILAGVIAGTVLGFHYRHARGAHADIKGNLAKLPGLRTARLRSGVIVAVVTVSVALLLYDLARAGWRTR